MMIVGQDECVRKANRIFYAGACTSKIISHKSVKLGAR